MNGQLQTSSRPARRARPALLGADRLARLASADARRCAGLYRHQAQARENQQWRHKRHAHGHDAPRHQEQFHARVCAIQAGGPGLHCQDTARGHCERWEALQPVPLHRRTHIRHEQDRTEGRACIERMAALHVDCPRSNSATSFPQKYIEASTIESECFDYRSGRVVFRFDYRTRDRLSGSTIEAEGRGRNRPATRMTPSASVALWCPDRKSLSASIVEHLCSIATPMRHAEGIEGVTT